MKVSVCGLPRHLSEFLVSKSVARVGANVRKSDLHKLINEFSKLYGSETPIIVGSQALYAVTDSLPQIARRSIECDFLFATGKLHLRDEIDTRLGIASDFRVEHGFYADGLGLATVTLPDGWETRLKPLLDENSVLVALCIDIYDLVSAKLVAGREKDLDFLKSLLLSDSIDMELILNRVLLVRDKVENDTLAIRLKRLLSSLSKESSYFRTEIDKLSEFIRTADL